MIGRSIAHYSILDKLGEGGMGVVYKARDSHLDRFVALKVLPADKVSDPERRQRFVQEAKSASALNHPNIVTIYDIDEAGGVHYIAMEYIEGRTLDRLIGRKGLPLNEALKYAIQIADGLGKAHAAGIVHRDLKPANIMVTGDGAVKILDFGLAKLVERSEETDESAPTRTIARTPKTEEGKILGTVAYMSPEQAEGRPVDARSDIFSFGSVFYEMLTGRRPFGGETRASTLAAILTSEPPAPSEIAAAVPAEAERAVMRCLRKDPQRRIQTMSDLKVLLQDLKEESESGKSPAAAAPGRRGRKTWLLAGVAALIVIAAAAGAVWWLLKSRTTPANLEVERLTFESGIANTPAISPDGKLIAYASDRTGGFDLYVRQINGQRAIRLTQNEANDWHPRFSPDGSKIAFRSERDGGGIYVVDALGGIERKIADRGRLPVYSPDGSTLLYLVATAVTKLGSLFLVPANGGAPRPFQPDFVIPPVGGGHSSPVWSPDGTHILFDGMRRGDSKSRSWWIAPVAGGDAVRLGPPPSAPSVVIRFVAAWQGNYVYYSEGTAIGGMSLYRVAMADGQWRVAGAPEKLASPAGMVVGASVSTDGRMVFASMTPSINIWSVALKANEGTASGQLQPVTSDTAGKTGFAVDAKGSKIAWVSYTMPLNNVEIHIRDLASGREELIAGSNQSIMLVPRMSADGSRIAYRDVAGGKLVSFVTEPGTTSARPVCERCLVHAFFANPAEALVQAGDQVVRQDLATGARVPLIDLSNGQQLFDFTLSPGDRLLAFTRARPDGMASLYVAPVGRQALAEKAWIQVAEDRNYLGTPAWSPDGKLLYYASARDGFLCVWAQRIAGDGQPIGQPFAVWHGHASPNFVFGVGARVEVAADKLYLLMAGIKGDLWSMKLTR